MGDRIPSQFLRRLRTLTGPSVPLDLLRTLWTNRLPQNIHSIITKHKQISLADVAQLADELGEVTFSPCFAGVLRLVIVF
jgi:hypothetical protein